MFEQKRKNDRGIITNSALKERKDASCICLSLYEPLNTLKRICYYFTFTCKQKYGAPFYPIVRKAKTENEYLLFKLKIIRNEKPYPDKPVKIIF